MWWNTLVRENLSWDQERVLPRRRAPRRKFPMGEPCPHGSDAVLFCLRAHTRSGTPVFPHDLWLDSRTIFSGADAGPIPRFFFACRLSIPAWKWVSSGRQSPLSVLSRERGRGAVRGGSVRDAVSVRKRHRPLDPGGDGSIFLDPDDRLEWGDCRSRRCLLFAFFLAPSACYHQASLSPAS